MQTLPLSHALAEFPLQLIMFFHGGAEKLVIPVQLLGCKKLRQDSNPRFAQLYLSFDFFYLFLDLPDPVRINLLLFQPLFGLRRCTAPAEAAGCAWDSC